jgi:hypothetical protein
MSETRLTLLPDERFVALLPALKERLAAVRSTITPKNFASLLDDTMRGVIKLAFQNAGADEGTIWLVDEQEQLLMPAYNTGPHAAKFVGSFSQKLGEGLLGMVLASERPFVENEMPTNRIRGRALDSLLQVETRAMIATPFYFLEACRGVISCIQLDPPPRHQPGVSGFAPGDEAVVRHAAATLGRLVDYRVLGTIFGLQ